MEKPEHEKLYTVSEAINILGVCRQTIYAWRDNGDIKTVRIGKGWLRIPHSEIERILENPSV